MKRVTVDIRMASYSGIGTYIRSILPLIIPSMPDTKFYLYGYEKDVLNLGNLPNVELIHANTSIYSLKEQAEFNLKIPRDTDLFWSPHYNIPLTFRGKLLVTIHDLFHLAMPQYVKGMHKQMYAKFMFWSIKKKARHIIFISNFTKKEFNRFVSFEESKTSVIYDGVDESWFKSERIQKFFSFPYIIYVGNVKPHKNLVSLVRAFENIKGEIPHNLVIVGKKSGFITGDREVINIANSMEDRIVFTDFVEDHLLKQLVSEADLLVFPSFYEGFGLPPLEGMASGCPVLVSNAASLPEVCQEAAEYFDPYNIQELSDKMKFILGNEKLQGEMVDKGKCHAMNYTWSDCAKQTSSIIYKLLK
ncbi:glycosyltransferase family 1 protein [Paenibacillus aurantius]|uniref:Glycosyltransferase family 1 protein n=1 Tax=Paenibacillus aurantius TaxID=2918900 RepID=A0AA96REE6_9BACL|nr:glycosyltransferase family 1 protein [Paenibacillus aurantius]WNQ10421.1 glycosyltransferase family 1 protein [Paenibacillus aurantius]